MERFFLGWSKTHPVDRLHSPRFARRLAVEPVDLAVHSEPSGTIDDSAMSEIGVANLFNRRGRSHSDMDPDFQRQAGDDLVVTFIAREGAGDLRLEVVVGEKFRSDEDRKTALEWAKRVAPRFAGYLWFRGV